MLRHTFTASALVLAVPAIATAQQAPVVFTGVSVIPMDRETVLANQTVIVVNGRWIGPAERSRLLETLVAR